MADKAEALTESEWAEYWAGKIKASCVISMHWQSRCIRPSSGGLRRHPAGAQHADQELEDELEVSLIERRKSGIELTEQGEEIVRRGGQSSPPCATCSTMPSIANTY